MATVSNSFNYKNPLHIAAYSGDEKRVRELVSELGKEALEARDGSLGDTPLMAALHPKNPDLDLVGFLLKSGASMATHNHRHDHPMAIAATKTTKAALGILIHYGGDVDYLVSPFMETALSTAVRFDRFLNILFLCRNDADPNKGTSPLFHALTSPTIMVLVGHGADVNGGVSDGEGATPLHQYVQKDKPDLAYTILTKRARVDAIDLDGFTPLYYAVKAKRKDLVLLLMSHQANPQARWSDFETIIEHAEKHFGDSPDEESILKALRGPEKAPGCTLQ